MAVVSGYIATKCFAYEHFFHSSYAKDYSLRAIAVYKYNCINVISARRVLTLLNLKKLNFFLITISLSFSKSSHSSMLESAFPPKRKSFLSVSPKLQFLPFRLLMQNVIG